MPPETIKDSLNLGLEVPAIFVPPKDRFNLKYGTCLPSFISQGEGVAQSRCA